MEDRNARLTGSDGVRQLPGSVRGAIVDDQHLRLGQGFEDRRQHALQVLDLVVGGQHHPHTPPGRQSDAGQLLGGFGIRAAFDGVVLRPVVQRPIPT